jgi:hypothetical protein
MAGVAGVVCALAASAVLGGGLLACRAPSTSGQQEVDVIVPGPDEGGADASDAGADGAAGEAGLSQVDRAGHPLTAVLLVPSGVQNDFNAQPSFEENVPRTLQDALESRLEALDTLSLGDGGPDPVDWPVPEGGAHPLLPAFVGDVLLVDPSLPCTGADGGYVASYFEIDREVYLGGPAHTTCGGRTPGENVVDETLTLLVTADRDGGPVVTQGVAGPTKAATTQFPYLAPPN